MHLADSLWTEWKIALRFLLDNRMQTLLIMFGIAVGSAVIVFITVLITGLQANVVERTLGTQAHIRILPPDEVNRILPADDHSWPLVLESPRAQRLRSIINWQDVRDVLDQDAQILAVSPVISGPAIARRGVARASVALLGIDPPRYQRIIPLADDLIAGQFTVGAGHAVIGKELARDLGLGIGDKLRLDAGEGREAVVDIAGIFELGVRELDARYVYLDLKQAQTLLDLPGGITVIDTTVAEIFEADQVAERLARLTGLRAESWMGNQRTTAQCACLAKHDHGDDPGIRRHIRGLWHRQRARRERRPAHPRDRHPACHGQPAWADPACVPATGRAARAARLGLRWWRRLGPGAGFQSVWPAAVHHSGRSDPGAAGHAGSDNHRRAGGGDAGAACGALRPYGGDSICLKPCQPARPMRSCAWNRYARHST